MGSHRVLLATLLLLGVACAEQPGRRVDNAVLICLDTVRADTLALVHHVLSGDDASIWWERGTSLVRSQSTAPWTLPAVASVFTGLYPNQHGAGTFVETVANLSEEFPLPLSRVQTTLAELLSTEGFDTTGFVAHVWFRQLFGLESGFRDLEIGDRVEARAVSWLRDRVRKGRDERFFLYLHFMEAHTPMHLERPALKKISRRVPRELLQRAVEANPRICRRRSSLDCQRYIGYVAEVMSLRSVVARLLSELDALGLLRQTAVVVFSDHGEEFLDHADEERVRALDPRGTYGIGHGHSLYQEQLRVPLVFWHPDLPPGEVTVRASLIDLAPTLLDWLGVAAPEMTGIALGPVLAGEVPEPHRPLFSSSVAFGPERAAVVLGNRKLVGDGGSGAGTLVFDLAGDPQERSPSGAAPELDALLAEHREARTARGVPVTPTSEELRELQALGYLQDARVE
jgi:arylsulfatase A-like enzyme